MQITNDHDEPGEVIAFGRWVLEQTERGGFIGHFAAIAKSDRGFLKGGAPNAVRKGLSDTGANPEMFEAIDDAELDWSKF